jgi:hypothetical protein
LPTQPLADRIGLSFLNEPPADGGCGSGAEGNQWHRLAPLVNFPRPDEPSQRENSMHFGGAMFFTDYSISATELALALEERGFESM